MGGCSELHLVIVDSAMLTLSIYYTVIVDCIICVIGKVYYVNRVDKKKKSVASFNKVPKL